MLLVAIRPEERVIWYIPEEPVIQACKHFAEYVSKHNSVLSQWEVAGFWWASLAVTLNLTVSDLALAIERWRERYEDCLLLWKTLYHDYQPTGKRDHELYWAVYADLKHSASLHKYDEIDKASNTARMEYLAKLLKVIRKGNWALPSIIQAKEAGEIEKFLNPPGVLTL